VVSFDVLEILWEIHVEIWVVCWREKNLDYGFFQVESEFPHSLEVQFLSCEDLAVETVVVKNFASHTLVLPERKLDERTCMCVPTVTSAELWHPS
jgi:hypothetical protein